MQKQKRHVKTSGRRSSRRALWMAMDVLRHPAVVQLTGVYHNLLRQWAEV